MKRICLAVIVSLTELAISACGTTTVNSTPESPGAAGSGGGAKPTATIGDTLKLSDSGMDVSLAITVKNTKRLPALKSYGMEMHPALYGVQIAIKNTGSSVYDDSVSNCAAAIDAKDQSHQAEMAPSDASGDALTGTIESVKVAPGDTRSGWVWFKAGRKVKFRTFQYTPASGMASTMGEWSLPK